LDIPESPHQDPKSVTELAKGFGIAKVAKAVGLGVGAVAKINDEWRPTNRRCGRPAG
jgi:hypothetical protein